jgi:hypothetical protein
MKNILLVNYRKQNCGIQQYGFNLGEILKKHSKNKIQYLEVDDATQFCEFLTNNTFDIFIFNWLSIKMSWINDYFLQKFPNQKKLFIFHDFEYPNVKSQHFILHQDPTKITNNITEFNLGRFLFDFETECKKSDKPIISSFGFAFFDKGFDKVVKKVNEEFDNAIIRLHLPNNTVVNVDKVMKHQILKTCELLNKNGNELTVTENYMSNYELLSWLNESTLNCFFYDSKQSLGISSVIDYALSVKVPLAITRCDMFRHIIDDEILIEKNTLVDIIEKGVTPLLKFKKNWNGKSFGENFDNIINLL